MAPRIVLFDIETIPNLLEALKVWPQLSDFEGRTLKADITTVICFGWMRLGDKKAKVETAWGLSGGVSRWGDVNDDYLLIKRAHAILVDADIIVTHNGKRFDLGFINTRILYWRVKKKDKSLTVLPPIPHIDTCQIARSKMYLFSNRLSRLGGFFGVGEKIDTGGWDLWVDVWHKKAKAMRLMAKYCKGDVELLARIFTEVKGISKDIPNMNLFSSRPVCPRCGHNALRKDRLRTLKSKIVQTYSCRVCGSWTQMDVKAKAKVL